MDRGIRLVGVTTIRDEADIVETFVRRNLVILDQLLIVLHRPSDGTREIAAALRKEGLPVRLFEDESEAFNQSARMNSLARRAFADDDADFVFPIDADEMLVAESRGALEASLVALPQHRGGVMQSLTFVGVDGDDPSELCPVRRIGHRFDLGPHWKEQLPQRLDVRQCKVVIGKWFAATPNAWIFEGNHVVLVDKQVAVQPMPEVRIAHYPVRSTEQLLRKCTLGWLSLLASGQEPEKHGFSPHWKQVYERISRGNALTDQDVRDFAALYASGGAERPLLHDPLPPGDYAINFAALRRPRPFVEVLLELAEKLARRAGTPRSSS